LAALYAVLPRNGMDFVLQTKACMAKVKFLDAQTTDYV